MTTIEIDEGVYRRDPRVTAGRRFTVYVQFHLGEPGECVEEIDVDAIGHADARAIAEVALARDYVDGGQIVRIDERFGWYS